MEVSRFGFNAPEVMQVLRSEVGVAVLGACGVPPDLFVGGSNSQAQREAWRRFILGSAESVAKLVEAELSAKLSSEITLDFSSTFAHDVQGRATSLAKMVSSGMPLQQGSWTVRLTDSGGRIMGRYELDQIDNIVNEMLDFTGARTAQLAQGNHHKFG